MPDLVDGAQALEAALREDAIATFKRVAVTDDVVAVVRLKPGDCVDCCEPIAPARLAAFPAGKPPPRCAPCQRGHERRRD
jgi:RNA polymerase-binding transcription factor DksA